jgi:glycosyltransferase involved in cell wall biosynthesis
MKIAPTISVIILTYNEERHIERCIRSVTDIATEIFVVDSYSKDRTLEIAESLGARVYQNPWVNHAVQFNWALDNLPITTGWVFRLDADEIVAESLKEQILVQMGQLEENITGVYVRRRMIFMGRWIKHGSMYPIYVMRLLRYGKGYCEQRWMDEHLKITEGEAITFKNDIIDDNRNNLGWWINKHNNYAVREAIELLNIKFGLVQQDGIPARLMGTQEQRKRWLKIRYASFPLYFRPFLYFTYRYLFRFGFLDGSEGLIWHFLQGFWYRFLIDAKISEIYRKGGVDAASIKRVMKEEYEIDLLAIS